MYLIVGVGGVPTGVGEQWGKGEKDWWVEGRRDRRGGENWNESRTYRKSL
jgi:hypothetical protein